MRISDWSSDVCSSDLSRFHGHMPRGPGSRSGMERRREGNGPLRAIGTALGSIAPITFFGSAAIAIGLILYASLAPDSAAVVFEGANDWIVAEAGWFYMLAVGDRKSKRLNSSH